MKFSTLHEYALPDSPIFVFVVADTPEQCLQMANAKMAEEGYEHIVFTQENLLLELQVKKQEPDIVEFIDVHL